MYPSLRVDLSKIRQNAIHLQQLCGMHNIDIWGITKVFAGELTIAETLVEAGIMRLGDSRIRNIKKYSALKCEKWLIRMPAVCEVEDVVRYCTGSVNSELNVLQMLQEAAKRQNRIHQIILMVDLGDLREGYFDEEELKESITYVKQSSCLELVGLGTNLTCMSFIQPDKSKLEQLVSLARKFHVEENVSGGNSATINLMLQGEIPSGITSLRLGESLLFGKERANYQYLDGMFHDAFIVEAQIIEKKEKPSMPIGTIGKDSYGRIHTFIDKGNQKRAICALGKQDVDVETMWPIDEGIQIIGASSDHMVIDVTNTEKTYRVGDVVSFRLGYFATLRAFHSDDIVKKIEEISNGGK